MAVNETSLVCNRENTILVDQIQKDHIPILDENIEPTQFENTENDSQLSPILYKNYSSDKLSTKSISMVSFSVNTNFQTKIIINKSKYLKKLFSSVVILK